MADGDATMFGEFVALQHLRRDRHGMLDTVHAVELQNGRTVFVRFAERARPWCVAEVPARDGSRAAFFEDEDGVVGELRRLAALPTVPPTLHAWVDPQTLEDVLPTETLDGTTTTPAPAFVGHRVVFLAVDVDAMRLSGRARR